MSDCTQFTAVLRKLKNSANRTTRKNNNKIKIKKETKRLKILSKEKTINYHQIFSENEVKFRKYLQNPKYRAEIAEAVNENRESLLHIACIYNEPHNIGPLIGLGNLVFKQDFYGRTPLHVALQRRHYDCVDVFVRLLKFPPVDQQDFIENLIKMFKIYNNDGYTVLHLAVLHNQEETVHVMLEFCQRFNLNVLEHEVLGSGDSILHLAVKNNLKNISEIILKTVKGSRDFSNYIGTKPLIE